MPVLGLDHVNIDTSIPDETIAFYQKVLGLENRPADRPAASRPGAWLWLGSSPIVHLHFVDDQPSADNGSFNHIAFAATDLADTCARLDSVGAEYRVSERPDMGVTQVFTTDPNGVRIELSFAAGSGSVPLADAR